MGAHVTCDFKTGKIILQQPIELAQASKLLSEGKTDLLENFVSNKTRRKFKAFLVYDKKEARSCSSSSPVRPSSHQRLAPRRVPKPLPRRPSSASGPCSSAFKPAWSRVSRCLTTVLVVVVGWGWLAREEARLDRELEARQTRLAALIEHGMAGPIWNLDRATVQRDARRHHGRPEVHSVELQGPGAAARLGLAPPHRATGAPMEWHFDIHYQPVGRAVKVIARATLISTRAGLEAKLAASRRLVGLLLATVLTGVVVGSLLLMQLLVKRPVQRLGQFAKRVASGELGAQVDVVSRDEIGDLTRQFNAMSQTCMPPMPSWPPPRPATAASFRTPAKASSWPTIWAAWCASTMRWWTCSASPRVVSPPSLSAWPTCSALRPRPPRAWKNASAARARCVNCRWNCAGPMAPGASLSWSAHWTGNAGERRSRGIVTDVTQRREAELELQAHRDRLEEQVASRTAAARGLRARRAAALSRAASWPP